MIVSRSVPKNDWHPASWQGFNASQQAAYPDKAALERAVADLSRLPPITTSWEVDALKEHIAKAQRGEAFGIQVVNQIDAAHLGGEIGSQRDDAHRGQDPVRRASRGPIHSAITLSLCSPSIGAGRRIAPPVSDSFTGTPSVL